MTTSLPLFFFFFEIKIIANFQPLKSNRPIIMAPPTPILSRDELPKFTPYDSVRCPLKQLTQYECSVRGTEIICVPFKRLFRACVGNRYPHHQTLIEVTDNDTNLPLRKVRVREIGGNIGPNNTH